MLYFLTRWVINAFVLILIGVLVPGVTFSNFYTALISALFLGFVNAIIRPILIVLTLPINLLTLGLFTLIINGLLFWFVSTFVKGFSIAGFWSAFWAALIYSIITWIFSLILKNPKEK